MPTYTKLRARCNSRTTTLRKYARRVFSHRRRRRNRQRVGEIIHRIVPIALSDMTCVTHTCAAALSGASGNGRSLGKKRRESGGGGGVRERSDENDRRAGGSAIGFQSPPKTGRKRRRSEGARGRGEREREGGSDVHESGTREKERMTLAINAAENVSPSASTVRRERARGRMSKNERARKRASEQVSSLGAAIAAYI